MSEDHTPVDTVAYKIFHRRFRVYLPAAYAHEFVHELIGTPRYQNSQQEQAAAQEPVLQQRTLADIVEFWDRGARIVFANKEDTVTAYQWLRDHLHNYYRQTNFSLRRSSVPLEDLEKMDRFAEALYETSRNHEKVPSAGSSLERKRDQLFANRMMSRQRPNKSKTEEEKEPPKHRSVIDDISKAVVNQQINRES